MTVYKMIELVGTSGTSVSDAIRGAIERASSTLDDVSWFEVTEIRGSVADGEVGEFQVKLDVGFVVHAKNADNEIPASRKTASKSARTAAAQMAAKGGQRKRTDLARNFEKQPRKTKE